MAYFPGGPASRPANLWDLPASPNAADDEFDSPTLDPAWESDVTISASAPDPYASFATDVRIEPDMADRPSWLRLQAGTSENPVLSKLYTSPANVFLWGRLQFSQRIVTNNNDSSISVCFFSSSGPVVDQTNGFQMFVLEANPGAIQAAFFSVLANVFTQINRSTDVDAQGQAIEYAGIQKIGTTYHGWAGTSAGNWIYMGSGVWAGPTLDRIGFRYGSAASIAPGNMIQGADFIRVFEGIFVL